MWAKVCQNHAVFYTKKIQLTVPNHHGQKQKQQFTFWIFTPPYVSWMRLTEMSNCLKWHSSSRLLHVSNNDFGTALIWISAGLSVTSLTTRLQLELKFSKKFKSKANVLVLYEEVNIQCKCCFQNNWKTTHIWACPWKTPENVWRAHPFVEEKWLLGRKTVTGGFLVQVKNVEEQTPRSWRWWLFGGSGNSPRLMYRAVRSLLLLVPHTSCATLDGNEIFPRIRFFTLFTTLVFLYDSCREMGELEA